MNSFDKKRIDKIYNSINRVALSGMNNLLIYKNLVDEIIQRREYDYYIQCLLYNYDIDVLNYNTSLDNIKETTWELICFRTLSPIQQKLKTLSKKLGIYQIANSIYSDNESFINFDWTGPFGVTYSSIYLDNQINFTKNLDNDVVINLLNPNIYDINIKSFEWGELNYEVFGLGRKPINTYEIYSVNSGTNSYLTQSSYNVHLNPGDYLVKVESRNTYNKVYYELNVYSNNHLGDIEEISSLESNINYYSRNQNLAKILGFSRTFLKVSKVNSDDFLVFNEINSRISEDLNLYNRYSKAFEYLTSNINWLLIDLDISNILSYDGEGKIVKNTLGNYNWAFLLDDPIYFLDYNKYIRLEDNNWSEIYDNSTLDLVNNSFSIEFWFRKLNNNSFAFGKPFSWELDISYDSAGIIIYIENKPYKINLNENIYLNKWYQIVVSKKDNLFKLYLNGMLKNTHILNELSDKFDSYDSNVVLLSKDNLKTSIDLSLLRIYNKKLTDDEVLLNFNILKGNHNISFSNENSIEDNLLLNLDAGLTYSYSTYSNIWMNSTNIIDNATFNGVITSNKSNKYIRCNGDIGDFIKVENSKSFNFGTSSFSVEWWFRKLEDSIDWSNIWGPNKWNSSDNPGTNEWAIFIGGSNSNTFGFMIETTENIYSINSDYELNLTDWNQLVGVKDDTEIKLYLNGSYVTSSLINSYDLNKTNYDILISNNTYTDTSNLFIWSKPLTDLEISDSYDNLISRYSV